MDSFQIWRFTFRSFGSQIRLLSSPLSLMAPGVSVSPETPSTPEESVSPEAPSTDAENPRKDYVDRTLKDLNNLSLKDLRSTCSANNMKVKGTVKQLRCRIKKLLLKEFPEFEVRTFKVLQKACETPFDYLVVIDFECTCINRDVDEELLIDTEPWLHEIIEFPAVIVDVKKNEIVAEFRKFVKPTVNPILTPFCMQLTGITQEAVDAADLFPDVLNQFQKFLRDNGLFENGSNYVIVNDDVSDLAKFFQVAVETYSLQLPHNFRTFVHVRKLFFANFQVSGSSKYNGLTSFMEIIGEEFEGNAHSGIDDTRNIAKIVMYMIREGVGIIPTHKLVRLNQIRNYPNRFHYQPRKMDDWVNKRNYGLVTLHVKHVLNNVHLRCESCNFQRTPKKN